MSWLRLVLFGTLAAVAAAGLGGVRTEARIVSPSRAAADASGGPSQNPPALSFAGQLGGGSLAVAAADDVAFVGAGPSIHALDTTSLGSPRLWGRSETFNDVVYDLVLGGDLLLAATGRDGLRVFDATAAAGLTSTTVVTTPAPAHGVAVASGTAYVVAAGSGVSAFSIEPGGGLSRIAEGDAPDLSGPVSAGPTGRVVALAGDRGALTLEVTNGVTVTFGTPFGAPSTDLDFDECEGRLALATATGIDLYDFAGAEPALVGRWSGAPATAVLLTCDRAFVGTRDRGVVVLDLSDPSTPVELAVVPETGWVAGVALVGNRLSVATNQGPLHPDHPIQLAGALDIVDLAGSVPARRSLYELPSGYLRDLDVVGSYVLATEGDPATGIPGRGWSFDITDPSRPVPAGNAALTGEPYAVSAKPPHGFFTSSEGFLVTTTDAEGRLRPQKRVANLLIGDADLARSAARLYAVGGVADLAVYDVGSPLDVQPVPLQVEPDLRGAATIAIEDGRAYIGGEQGIYVLDVRSPSYPRTLARFPNLAPSADIAAFGRFALSADRTVGLRVVDSTQVSRIRDLQLDPTPGLAAVATSGGAVYTLSADGDLQLIDLSEPSDPQVAGRVEAPAFARPEVDRPAPALGADMVAVADLALVAHPSRGFLVYRAGRHVGPTPTPVSDAPLVYLPAASKGSPPSRTHVIMTEVAKHDPLNTSSWGLDVDGDRAFVGRQGGIASWVAVMDVHDPSAPFEIARSPDLAGVPSRLEYGNGYVYVAAGSGGLQIVDVRDSSRPTIVGQLATTREYSLVARSGDGKLAYAVETRTGGGETVLVVIDVDDPSAPTEVGRVTVSETETAVGITVLGDQAHLTLPSSLAAVDVGNPIAPEVVGQFALDGAMEPVAGVGQSRRGLVAVGNRGSESEPGGLWLLDSAEPRAMDEAGSLVSLDWPEIQGFRQLSWNGDRLLAASEDDLRLFDMTDFRWPRVSAEINDQYSDIWEVVLTDRNIYLTEGAQGLVVLALRPNRIGTVPISAPADFSPSGP